MTLTPLDIHHKEFRTARFGGYNEEEVDSFLDQVADEYEKLTQDTVELGQQAEQLKKRLAEFEEMQSSLQAALLAATKSAEAVREEARQESEATISKAQEEADSLVKSAQEQSRQMILGAQNERQKLERNFIRLKEIKGRYLQSLKEMAEAHLRQVAELESKDEGEPAKATPDVAKREAEEELPLVKQETAPPETPPVTIEPDPPPVQPRPVEEARSVSPPPTIEREATPKTPPPQEDPPIMEASRHEVPREVSIDAGAGIAATDAAPRGVTVRDVGKGVDEKAPASADLVDEVLSMGEGSEIYSEFPETGAEDEDPEKRGRRGRKEKKDKHFFWE